jgi:hypothetical protein
VIENGLIMGVYITLTDNSFGDANLALNAISDPGVFYRLVAQVPVVPQDPEIVLPPSDESLLPPSGSTGPSGDDTAQAGSLELASTGDDSSPSDEFTGGTFIEDSPQVVASGAPATEIGTLEISDATAPLADDWGNPELIAGDGSDGADSEAAASSEAPSLDLGTPLSEDGAGAVQETNLVQAFEDQASSDLIAWAADSGLIYSSADGGGDSSEAAATTSDSTSDSTADTTSNESRPLAFVAEALGVEPSLASGMLEALVLGGASLYALNRFSGGKLSRWVQRLLPAARLAAAAPGQAERIVVVFKLLSETGLQRLVAAQVGADTLEILAEQALPMSLSAAAAPALADLEPHLRKLVERVSNQAQTHDLLLYDPHLRQDLPEYESLGRTHDELRPQSLHGILTSLEPDQLLELRNWIQRPSGIDLREHPVGHRLEKRQHELRRRMDADKASLVSLLELSLALGQRFA